MNNFSGANTPLISFEFLLLYIWSLVWKGIALWRASKSEQRNWFVAILVLNTAGVLEIVYLFKFAKNKLTSNDLKVWEHLPRNKKKK